MKPKRWYTDTDTANSDELTVNVACPQSARARPESPAQIKRRADRLRLRHAHKFGN